MKLIKIIAFSFFLLICSLGFTAPSPTPQDYFSSIAKAANQKNWKDVVYFSKMIQLHYPKNNFSQDVTFYLAEAYYNQNELELASSLFSKYLTQEITPKFFEKAILYKFEIAKKFYDGAKKHFLGIKKMPKLLSAKEDALKIFDEVISVLPNDPLGAQSMYYKAKLQFIFEDYKESIETFQSLIRKFPKHELAIESFLEIEKVYLVQADPKRQDPDLLDMAEVNLQKFKEAFPKEEKIALMEKDLSLIKEKYAKGLFEIGDFYERTKKSEAALIYYNKVISAFPSSEMAALSQKRINRLEKK